MERYHILHSGQNSSRNDHHNGQQPLSPEQEMTRQIEEFNRSVTIVIWYQANTEPIRLHHMVTTFPYFQLSRCTGLINNLALSFSSYLDAWIPSSGQWEQQTISAVRMVESQQRLLYKVRHRLTEPLPDADCLCLHEEFQLLLSMNEPNGSQNKRPLKSSMPSPDGHESGSSPMNGLFLHHSGSNIGSGVEDNSPQAHVPDDRQNNDGDDNDIFIYHNMYYPQQQQHLTDNSLPHYLLSPTVPTSSIPHITHPPLKRWPNDYTVSEIARGFAHIDMLNAHSAVTGGMTQKQAFERVFGCRYVKSTVCRHRAVWRKANPALKEQYEAMGADERACWGEFVRRVEGRSPGKNNGCGADAMMSPSPTTAMGYQSGDEEDGVHGQEGVIALSQNQVIGPSNPNPGSSSTIVFDSSRNRVGVAGHAT